MARRPSQRGELIGALQQSVRRFGDEVNRYEAAVAERLGMHATDLHYLGFVELYGPTTAGHLAELGGLTTGAVTGVIDRLEKAGYVRRESDPSDRRKVVIRLMPGAAERAGALYQPMLASTDPLWERYSDDELAVILDFADRAQPLLHEGTAWLRGGTARPPRAATRVDAAEIRSPLGGLSEATLRFVRGAGHVHIRGDRELTELYHGQFPGNVPSARVERGVVSLRYGRSPFRWMARHGELALSTAVRWRVEVEAGMTRVVAELEDLDIRAVTFSGGVSHASMALPSPRGIVPIQVTGGVNDLTITRPAGTAARLRVRGGASNVVFDGRRFASLGRDARWASTDGDDPDQYEIEIAGGARTLTVTTR
jgi:DNA-binding MarR family transcriptional regulator